MGGQPQLAMHCTRVEAELEAAAVEDALLRCERAAVAVEAPRLLQHVRAHDEIAYLCARDWVARAADCEACCEQQQWEEAMAGVVHGYVWCSGTNREHEKHARRAPAVATREDQALATVRNFEID